MTDDQSPINADEFRRRLAAMCLKTGQPGLPRKRRDQQIVFKSVILTLDTEVSYDEAGLKERLQHWQRAVGRELQLDHVSLRRHLVDDGYLERDPAGNRYRVADVSERELFAPGVDDIDPAAVITEAELERAEKKRRYMSKRA